MEQSDPTMEELDKFDGLFDNEQYLADESDDLLAALGASNDPPENQAPTPSAPPEPAQNGAYYPDNSNGGPSPPATQVFPQNGTPNGVSGEQHQQQHHPQQHQQQPQSQQASFQIQSQMQQQPEHYPMNHVNTSMSNNGMPNGNHQPNPVPIHANMQHVQNNTSSTVTLASPENNQMPVPVAQTRIPVPNQSNSDPASIIDGHQATLHSSYTSAVDGNTNNLKQLSEDVIELLDDEDEEKPASADGQLSKRPRVLSPASLIPPPPPPHAAAAASNDARYANMPQWMKGGVARPPGTPIIPGQTIPGYNDQYSSAQAAKKIAHNNQYSSAQAAKKIAQMYGAGDHNLERKRKITRQHLPRYVKLPLYFVPSWPNLMPDAPPPVKPVENKSYELSLLNLEQFTITGLSVISEGPPSSVAGLRKKIKEISKDYGKAVYEREGNEGEGRWQIPLGAYNNFYAYLNSQSNTKVLGIPLNQLQIASIGKARLSKGYPTMRKLIEVGVPRGLATALAPFQRGGVDFVIAKDGRALIADDMGLGKTIQAIASASVYHNEWPILILTPSSARYHWSNEFEQWLGVNSNVNQKQTARIDLGDDGEDEEHDDSPMDESKCMTLLDKSEIHVLTKSKEAVIPNKSTRVVICSYGLAPALVERGSLYPGLFKCAIVDESHMLKNMSTKRTKLLVPVLHATQRCVLLSGTPALARPSELWPQLKILGTEKEGWWEDESEFINNYVKKSSPARRAELHAMLTGTVMIRRMKTDILKSLPKKVREKAVVDVSTKEMRKEFHQCMNLLREGKGVLGRLARQQSALAPEAIVDVEYGQEYATAVPEAMTFDMQKHQESLSKQMKQRLLEGRNRIQHTLMTTPHQLDENQKNDLIFKLDADLKTEIKVWFDEKMLGLQQKKEKVEEGPTRQSVLNRMYSLTAKAKIPLLVDMIKKWLADPTKGKLCVFAHHLFMLDAIVNDVGLLNAADSKTKYIRIDGSTQPMDRQNQIKAFQNDPSIRIAVLGITAAGVAVTLTASSTVWFTELFWTPALMIQAEDRCHRIGQNSRVQCLYFVAVGTLDELLWKMLEGKFQDLGEFVEGKEKQKLTVHRVYTGIRDLHTMFSRVDEDDSDDDAKGSGKEESDDDELLELDVDLEKDIAELAKEELMEVREEADEDENEADSKPEAEVADSTTPAQEEIHGRCEEEAIMLSDDEDGIETEAIDPKKLKAVPPMPESKQIPLPPLAKFNMLGVLPNCKLYKLLFDGPSYGIQLRVFIGKLIVLRKTRSEGSKPHVGDILVALNGQKIPVVHHLEHMLPYLKTALRHPPVELTFAEDNEFRDFAIPQILAEIKDAEEKDMAHRMAEMKKAEEKGRANRMANQNWKKQEDSDDVIVLD